MNPVNKLDARLRQMRRDQPFFGWLCTAVACFLALLASAIGVAVLIVLAPLLPVIGVILGVMSVIFAIGVKLKIVKWR